MKLDAFEAIADDQQEEGKRRPSDSDPGGGDFFERQNGYENGTGPSVKRRKEAGELGIARSAEIGTEVEKHGHQREGKEADGQVMPLLGGIHVYEKNADESREDNGMGLEAEIATSGVDSENRKNSGEDAPRDCNPK